MQSCKSDIAAGDQPLGLLSAEFVKHLRAQPYGLGVMGAYRGCPSISKDKFVLLTLCQTRGWVGRWKGGEELISKSEIRASGGLLNRIFFKSLIFADEPWDVVQLEDPQRDGLSCWSWWWPEMSCTAHLGFLTHVSGELSLRDPSWGPVWALQRKVHWAFPRTADLVIPTLSWPCLTEGTSCIFYKVALRMAVHNGKNCFTLPSRWENRNCSGHQQATKRLKICRATWKPHSFHPRFSLKWTWAWGIKLTFGGGYCWGGDLQRNSLLLPYFTELNPASTFGKVGLKGKI